MVKIGGESVFLFQTSVQDYKQGENVSGHFATNAQNLGKTIYVETFKGISNLLVGTGNVFKNVSKLTEGTKPPSDAPKPMHVKAHSPNDMTEGIALAGGEIYKVKQKSKNSLSLN